MNPFFCPYLFLFWVFLLRLENGEQKSGEQKNGKGHVSRSCLNSQTISSSDDHQTTTARGADYGGP